MLLLQEIRQKKIFSELLEEDRLKQKKKESIQQLDDNTKVIALNRAHILALRAYSAKEAIELLTGSERINEDLLLALEDKQNFTQKLIVRKWVGVPIEFEFRGFVNKKKLNAMCQYYHYIYFPHLVQQKEEIEKLIKDLYETIKDIIPLESLVLDFAVDLQQKKAMVIEINPFNNYEGCGTSASMFNWTKDRKVLDEGPFQFRIEVESNKNIRSVLGPSWKQLIEDIDK